MSTLKYDGKTFVQKILQYFVNKENFGLNFIRNDYVKKKKKC